MSVFLSFLALSAELEESLLREDIQSLTCTLLDFCKESADDFSISERRGLSDCDNCEPKEEFIQILLRALLLVQLRQNSCVQKLNLADEDSGMNFLFPSFDTYFDTFLLIHKRTPSVYTRYT